MTTNAANSKPSNFTPFQYQLLPSAFKIVEYPTHICWQLFSSTSAKLWNQNAADGSEKFKNCSLAILSGVGGYLGGIAALPVTLCSVPITAIADVVVGVAECAFCLYHGMGRAELLTIAHRKFIVSPCQHLAFCIGTLAGLGVGYAIICGYTLVPIFWTVGYAFGQFSIGILPKNLNHHSYNIMCNGGSGENEDKKWADEGESFKEEHFNKNIPSFSNQIPPSFPGSSDFPPQSTSKTEWINFIEKEIPHLSHINDANLSKEYISYKQRLLQKCSPEELLELPANFTQAQLRQKYRILALILHPDKNAPRRQEAEALFKVLNEANAKLKNNL